MDEEVAFIGGIDLCYNRFDTCKYSVGDIEGELFPGRDYSNLSIVGETNGKPWECVLERKQYPRMPWHDIQVVFDGQAAAGKPNSY